MTSRLAHDNVERNPSASYLFIEQSEGYLGKRLSLIVPGEESSPEKIKAIRSYTTLGISGEDSKHLVHFRIKGARPSIGSE
jgi:hypothetical protein